MIICVQPMLRKMIPALTNSDQTLKELRNCVPANDEYRCKKMDNTTVRSGGTIGWNSVLQQKLGDTAGFARWMFWCLMCWGARKELEEIWKTVMQARQYKPLTRHQRSKKPVMVRNSDLPPTSKRVFFCGNSQPGREYSYFHYWF